MPALKKIGRFTSDNRPTPPRQTHHRQKQGIPPPVTFDLERLPPGTLLTGDEAAAVLRKAIGTVAQWRRNPEHALLWEYIGGRALYRAGDLRAFLEQERAKHR